MLQSDGLLECNIRRYCTAARVIALPRKLLHSRANRIKCASAQIDNHYDMANGNSIVNIYYGNSDGQQRDSRKRRIAWIDDSKDYD